MFSIGDFAALGRVSVRMLRHYDAIGLLTPAEIDPHTGYRSYRADQLRRLNRVIALKDLGFTLGQVATILDDTISAEELHGMLRLRRAQLEAQLSADAARLSGVEARLRMIEMEGRMSTDDVVLKQVPRVRVAELTAVAASYEGNDITPVIGPLYEQLTHRLDVAGVPGCGPAIAYYEPEPGPPVRVHAAIQVSNDLPTGTGARDQTGAEDRVGVQDGPGAEHRDFDVLDLPGIDAAATIVHHGPMSEVMRSMQTLARWIDDNGYRPVGYAREVCLQFDPENPDNWVHELQLAVVPASSPA